MNKVTFRLTLLLLYVTTVAAGALFSMRIVANASTVEEAAEELPLKKYNYDDWYDRESGKLTLRLENHIPGYTWKIGFSDDRVLDIEDCHYDKYGDRIIVLVPEKGKAGNVTLTAACMKDINTRPIDRRRLNVSVSQDGDITVSAAR